MTVEEFHEVVKMVIRKPNMITVFTQEGEPIKLPCNGNTVVLRKGVKMVVPTFTIMEGDLIISHRRV